MFRLGVRNEARGIVHGVHSSRFDLDEDALPLGAAALARIAMDYVQRER
jgi:amidohydrolase